MKDLSIIIPVHNVCHFTKACVESIKKHTTCTYEIIIIDDASTDETAKYLKSLSVSSEVKIITNEQRRNYSYNNNRGFELSKGRHICLLNNDTLLTPSWNEEPLKILEENRDVGVVGNKHIFPQTNLLNHCGIAFDADGHPWHLHPHSSPDLPSANYVRDVPAVTFACVFINRDVYKNLNGLNENYINGYEDCDFCLRVRRSGHIVKYTPASTIYHYGQSSPGRTDKNEENWNLFSKSWQGFDSGSLEDIGSSDNKYNSEYDFDIEAKDRDGVHFALDLKNKSAFAWAGADLALAFDKLNHKVSLPNSSKCIDSSFEGGKRFRLNELKEEQSCKSVQIKFTHYWEDYLKQDLSGKLDLEIYCTNYRFRNDKNLDPWNKHVKYNSNKKLAVGQFCKEALLDIGVSEEDIRVLPLGYSTEIDDSYSDYLHLGSKQKELQLFVMTNSHDLYRYGTDILINALGNAFTKDDKVVIHIKDYGQGAQNTDLEKWISKYPNFPKVVWHKTFISKENLIALYTKMDALIAPFRGEGFGMKVIDSMALGVPVLMPNFGGVTEYAEKGSFIELDYNEVPVGECYDTRNSFVSENAYWCEVDTVDLSNKLKSILQNRSILEEVGKKAKKAVFSKYNWHQAAVKLQDAIHYFQTKRDSSLSKHKDPSTYSLSVLIPTKNRIDILKLTLDGYLKQTKSLEDFEIVLVNDYGDFKEVESLVSNYSEKLNIKLLNNQGLPGPASARNLGIYNCSGKVIFITGDDIIPSVSLVTEHINAHAEYPGVEHAFVGNVAWHDDCDKTWLMNYIVGEGGQQFNYIGMEHKEIASYDRFYTSNVSLKRSFLLNTPQLFSTAFNLAAFEDIEFGYRLGLRGMELRYLETAIGYHHHQMALDSFVQRQVRVGQMLTVLNYVQPNCVSENFSDIFGALEAFKRNKDSSKSFEANTIFNELKSRMISAEAQIDMISKLDTTAISKKYLDVYRKELESCRKHFFRVLCDLAVRKGLALQWCEDEKDFLWAYAISTNMSLRSLLSVGFTLSSVDNENDLALNDTRSEIRSLYHEIDKLKVSVANESKKIHGMQSWVSDFSIIGRAKNKLSRFVK